MCKAKASWFRFNRIYFYQGQGPKAFSKRICHKRMAWGVQGGRRRPQATRPASRQPLRAAIPEMAIRLFQGWREKGSFFRGGGQINFDKALKKNLYIFLDTLLCPVGGRPVGGRPVGWRPVGGWPWGGPAWVVNFGSIPMPICTYIVAFKVSILKLGMLIQLSPT
jgi:hypothetical protein